MDGVRVFFDLDGVAALEAGFGDGLRKRLDVEIDDTKGRVYT